MSVIKAYLMGDDGASAAEYALILAIVGTAIAGACIILGQNISTAINSAATCVKTPTGC
jgi:pilus assembly protein Flp/PilA